MKISEEERRTDKGEEEGEEGGKEMRGAVWYIQDEQAVKTSNENIPLRKVWLNPIKIPKVIDQRKTKVLNIHIPDRGGH